MSFMKIWDNASYKETGLPCTAPVLAVVCPSDPDSVYFALKQRIFSINVPARRLMHNEAYALVNIPGPPRPAFMAWELPPIDGEAEPTDAAVPSIYSGSGEAA